MIVGLVAGAALAVALLPPLAAALAVLLAGVIVVAGLRVSLMVALLVGVGSVAALILARLYLGAAELNPWATMSDLPGLVAPQAASGLGLWLPLLPVIGLLLAAVPATRALSKAFADLGKASPVDIAPTHVTPAAPEPQGTPVLARTRALGSDYLLALVVVSPAATEGHDAGHADDSTAMRRLDALIFASLGQSASICKYGPLARLIVLPLTDPTSLPVWTALAGQQIGRETRYAAVNVPEWEADLGALLSQLEESLDLPYGDHDVLGFLTQVALVATERGEETSGGGVKT